MYISFPCQAQHDSVFARPAKEGFRPSFYQLTLHAYKEQYLVIKARFIVVNCRHEKLAPSGLANVFQCTNGRVITIYCTNTRTEGSFGSRPDFACAIVVGLALPVIVNVRILKRKHQIQLEPSKWTLFQQKCWDIINETYSSVCVYSMHSTGNFCPQVSAVKC